MLSLRGSTLALTGICKRRVCRIPLPNLFILFLGVRSVPGGAQLFLRFFLTTADPAFLLSNFATASASHAAFSFPLPAEGRLLHSRDPESPAISAKLRLLRTDSSYSSMS